MTRASLSSNSSHTVAEAEQPGIMSRNGSFISRRKIAGPKDQTGPDHDIRKEDFASRPSSRGHEPERHATAQNMAGEEPPSGFPWHGYRPASPPHSPGCRAASYRRPTRADAPSKVRQVESKINTSANPRDMSQEPRENVLADIRKGIGLRREAPIVHGHVQGDNLKGFTWASVRYIFREPFAEFFGTFLMILMGNGSIAQVLLSTGEKTAPGGNGYGNYQSIEWGWAIGVSLGIYVAGESGGFLNPALTFGFCLYRKLPWKRLPIYFISQLLAGFLASGVVYAIYLDAINSFEGPGIRTVTPSKTATAGIFCTFPQTFLSKGSQFMSEFCITAIMMFVIFGLKDESNTGAMGKSGAGKLFPLALLFLTFGLNCAFGWQTGAALNLARDFGPRTMAYFLGYGQDVWSTGGYYFWIPMVAPFCGAMFGGFLYDVFIYTGPESPINQEWLGLKFVFDMTLKKQKKEMEEGEV